MNRRDSNASVPGYGPPHSSDAMLGPTNGAQPDWYLGWLIGALRLVPSFDLVIDGYTLVPNPFWGGIAFPGVVFTLLGAWPFLEARLTRDRRVHNVLDRPRDAPNRTAFGVALMIWVVLIFIAGSADRAEVFFGVPYVGQIWVYRVLVWVAPVIGFVITRRVCRELQRVDRLNLQEEQEEEAVEEQIRASGTRALEKGE
jgi:ubiquinol-cytochrome c reductase cytochrome b subunit